MHWPHLFYNQLYAQDVYNMPVVHMQGNPLMPPDLLMSAFLSLINNRMGAKRIKNRPQRVGPMGVVSRVGHWFSCNTPWLCLRATQTRAERAFMACLIFKFMFALKFCLGCVCLRTAKVPFLEVYFFSRFEKKPFEVDK